MKIDLKPWKHQLRKARARRAAGVLEFPLPERGTNEKNKGGQN
jgi:hypothetical protein